MHLGSAVASVSSTGITLADDTNIKAGIVIWARELKPSHLLGPAGLKTGRGGRVDVDPDLPRQASPGFMSWVTPPTSLMPRAENCLS